MISNTSSNDGFLFQHYDSYSGYPPPVNRLKVSAYWLKGVSHGFNRRYRSAFSTGSRALRRKGQVPFGLKLNYRHQMRQLCYRLFFFVLYFTSVGTCRKVQVPQTYRPCGVSITLNIRIFQVDWPLKNWLVLIWVCHWRITNTPTPLKPWEMNFLISKPVFFCFCLKCIILIGSYEFSHILDCIHPLWINRARSQHLRTWIHVEVS